MSSGNTGLDMGNGSVQIQTFNIYYVSELQSQPEMLLDYVKMSDKRNNETQGHLQSSLDGLSQWLKMKIDQNKNIWSVRNLYCVKIHVNKYFLFNLLDLWMKKI